MRLAALVFIGFLGLTPAVQAGETYDLLFRQGTLDGVATGTDIRYLRQFSGQIPNMSEQSGDTHLRLEIASGGQARLHRSGEAKEITELSADASVGNPMAMYFLETTARQLARATGGSPFYLRNRLKEALLDDRPPTDEQVGFDDATVPATIVVLKPFQNDRNRAKLGPLAELTLTVTMSEEVPGWYYSFVAEAPAMDGGEAAYLDRLSIVGD